MRERKGKVKDTHEVDAVLSVSCKGWKWRLGRRGSGGLIYTYNTINKSDW